MIYVMHNATYVAAITNSAKKLSEWLGESPLPDGMQITTLVQDFPLYIVENNTGFHFFSEDYETKQTAHYAKSTHGTLYKVPDCWRGDASYSDLMGLLDHIHFE